MAVLLLFARVSSAKLWTLCDLREKKMTNEKDRKGEGIVESFLGGIPLFGDLFKELAKAEAFQEKFKEIDKKIEENLRNGQKKKWGVESHISVRSINNEVKKDTPEIFISEDYFYGKKGNRLIIAVRAPKENVDLNIKGKTLLISSDDLEKKVELPDYFRNITKKLYKKGILLLELTK